MPPKHPKPLNHLIKPADRLALAITALKTGKCTTIHEAATQNAVPESTLRARVKSAGFRFPRRAGAKNKNTRRKEFRLTRTEENTLANWIIQVHEGGQGITPDRILDMVNTLLAKRGGTHGFRVTPGWVEGYLEFHPEVAALVEEDNENLTEDSVFRPGDLYHDPEDPEGTLKFAEAVLFNTIQHAKNEYMWEQARPELKKREATGSEYIRTVLPAFEKIRQDTAWLFPRLVQRCKEYHELLSDFDVDMTVFYDGYRELLKIMEDTKRLKEQIRVENGEEMPVEKN
ncbi:hypothetical protein F1880_007736 [Penicillium rolfsii]|nr:hypothetical protein F1880_007736 [Penicillium rolfsii]